MAPHAAVAQNAKIEPAGGLFEKLLLQEVNQKRAAAGKLALKLDDRISALARDVVGKFTSGEIPMNSASIRGQRAVQRAAAITQVFGNGTKIEENFQPTGTPNSVANTWMSHDNERNRMLGEFTLAGIGIAADRQGNINYGMIFVAPSNANAPSNPTPPGRSANTLTQITLVNASFGEVRIFLLHNGVEALGGTIPAGQSRTTMLASDQTYIFRDNSGQELKRFTVTKSETIRIESAGKSTPSNPPTANTSLVGGKYTGMSKAQLEQEVIKEINKQRRANGLAALQHDQKTTAVARTYSDDVASSVARWNQVFSGPGPRGQQHEPAGHWNMIDRAMALRAAYGDRTHFGENVMATGSPESVVKNWMNSPGHRSNMLHAVPTRVGVAIGVRNDGQLLYTAIFTNPQNPNGVKKTPLTATERQTLIVQAKAAIEKERRGLGGTFRSNNTLASVAQQWAERNARMKISAAQSLGATAVGGPIDRANYRFRKIGEGSGIDLTPEQAAKYWTSPSNREREYTRINSGLAEYGLGVARGDNGKVYWSIVFGVPF